MSKPYTVEEQIIDPWFHEHLLLAFRIDKALALPNVYKYAAR